MTFKTKLNESGSLIFKTKLNTDGTVQITHTPKGHTELVYTVEGSISDPGMVYVLNGTEDSYVGSVVTVALSDLVSEIERRSEKALALHASVYKTLNSEPTKQTEPEINIPDDFDLSKLPEFIFKILRERGVTL